MSSTLTIVRQRRQRRQQVRNSARQRSRRTVLGFGFIIGAVTVVLVLAVALAYAGLTRGLPSVRVLPILLNPQDGLLLQPTRLYDRTGQHLLATLSPTDDVRVYAIYGQLPRFLVDATIAAAEPRFWSSPGYASAGWRDPQAHSSLAQQLIYNLLLWNEPPSSLRAFRERILAAQVTAEYGREQVLEWYLNSVNYGHFAYGAEAAAQLYLGKSVTQLDLSEAALLAAASQAPALNPIDNPLAAEERRVETLQAMLAQGMISPDEAAQAILEKPSTPPPSSGFGKTAGGEGSIAPAFVNLVISQLEARYGTDRFERGGMVVVTSLDYDLQTQTVCGIQVYLARLSGDTTANDPACETARLLPVIQPGDAPTNDSASALVLDPQTGQVLAAVGDIQDGQQGYSLVSHPAGTSITPFVYLTAFSRGLNPATLAWDIPGSLPNLGQVYHGPVRLRTALANDYLAPAVSLLDQLGGDSIQNIAAPFGLDFPSGKTLLKDDFELSPLALAQAYGIFANSGVLAGQSISNRGLEPVTVLQVSSLDHSILADWSASQQQSIVSQQLAYLMNQVLSDEAARWPSLGHPNSLEIGRPAGAKLSRSLDLSAAWTVGYTPQRVTVIWLGEAVSGNATNPGEETVPPQASADLWHALMQYSLRNLPSAIWEMPSGIVTVNVCDPSGLLPTSACPNTVSEIFLEGRQPVQTDTLYQTFQVNVETGLLATVFTPPELVEDRTYLVAPPQARAWAKTAGIPVPPTAYDTLQEPPSLPDAHITTPEQFSDGRGKLEIRGSATGADFVLYRLEYGQGLYPHLWTQIGTDSTSPVTENALAEWDTSGLDGLYALRLMVVRSNQRVDQAVVQVTLDNTPPQVAVSYPQDGQMLSLAQQPQVALQAQVNDPFLAQVEFFVDDLPLGESDTAPFGILWQAKAGNHTLRVTATDRAGNTRDATVEFSVK